MNGEISPTRRAYTAGDFLVGSAPSAVGNEPSTTGNEPSAKGVPTW